MNLLHTSIFKLKLNDQVSALSRQRMFSLYICILQWVQHGHNLLQVCGTDFNESKLQIPSRILLLNNFSYL
jgi:hypothetical protein